MNRPYARLLSGKKTAYAEYRKLRDEAVVAKAHHAFKIAVLRCSRRTVPSNVAGLRIRSLLLLNSFPGRNIIDRRLALANPYA